MTGSKQGTDHTGADPYSKLSKAQARNRRTGPIIIGITVAAVAVIALVTFLATRGSDDTASSAGSGSGASAAANATQETATVTVEGEDLPRYPDNVTDLFTTASDDPAVGKVAPTLVGESFDGSKLTIDPTDGTPKVILFVAHWCPHCQREVPLIQKWIADGNLPKGVEMYTVSTAVSDQRPNYPPSKWLSSVGWQPKVMLDDASQTAAQAYGLASYPYFVMTDGAGKVVTRGTGEVPIDQFGAKVEGLAKSADGSTTTTAATG